MKILTKDLIGPPLDWAVAKCEGIELFPWPNGTLNVYRPVTDDYAVYEPHYRWAQGGPIIERMFAQGLHIRTNEFGPNPLPRAMIVASLNGDVHAGFYFGPTPLVAAMRCYVASKLGDEVEISEELLK